MLTRLTVALALAGLSGLAWSPTLAQPPAPEQEAETPGIRVEVPEAGYALTFPDGWEVDPDVASTIVERPEGRRVRISLLASSTTEASGIPQERCNVIHYLPAGASLDDAVAQEVAGIIDMGDRLAAGAYVTLLELRGGPATRVEYEVHYPDFARFHAAYFRTDGTVVDQLTCSGASRPADAWLSIAATFERLTDGQ